MAVENTKSTHVTNLDQVPQKVNAALVSGGRVREVVESVAVAAADDDTSTYRFFRVWSGWRISSLEVFNDAITGGTDYDAGIYDTAENGGAVVDINAYGDAVSMATARVAPLDIAYEVRNITAIKQKVWEDLALSADPGKWYDLVLTGVTVGTAAGDISLRLRYTDGS